MIKKIAILFSLALIALGVNAQLPTGGWTFHPTFNGVSSMTETQGMLYYLSGNSLYSVNKQTQELRSLNIANDLNGSKVTNIFTQPEGKYVIVLYADNSMDRLNDDGSVINISDIRDASINGKADIKHVGFGKGKFYVTTDFGVVTFDEKKNEARETMFTPLAPVFAYGLGDKIIISYDQMLMAADATKKITSLDQFSLIGDNQTKYSFSTKGLPISDNRLLLVTTSNNLVIAHFEFDTPRLVYFSNTGISGITGIFNMKDGNAVAYNTTTAAVFNSTDAPTTSPKLTLPAALKSHKITALNGWSNTWAGNSDGIAEFDLSTFSAPVQLCDKFGKTEFTASECCRVFTQPDGSIFFWNPYSEMGELFGEYPTTAALRLTSYNRNSGFADITPKQKADGSTVASIANAMWVTQDPRNPARYYISTWNNGIWIVEDNVIVKQITITNSPLTNQYSYRISYIGFDGFDNFWVAQEYPFTDAQNIHVISYNDLQGDFTKENWTTLDGGTVYRSSVGTALKKTNRMVVNRRWSSNLTFIDQNNTSSPADDKPILVSTFVDQDNKTVTVGCIGALTEDANGRLWIGTNNGVIEITDPSKVTSETAQVNHLKVPRNDGTGLADYLLESQLVADIACDNSNRKWIATTTNGVYLVSENGDEILENFTTDNSILPSNRVWSVACDPNSSSVFFATDAGVVEYSSTSSPAMKNLDEVYAYPNPVRPEYSGWITITGLIDNTLVKIADAAGNVFFQGRSEGGMITWDGCNPAGERVKTGVYYVFASHGTSNDSSSEGCVTKIMVVN